jgi:hypothetical protein
MAKTKKITKDELKAYIKEVQTYLKTLKGMASTAADSSNPPPPPPPPPK